MDLTPWTYSIIFLATVFILLYVYFTRNFNYWKKRNVFFVKPAPFFGNLLPFLNMKQTFGIWLGDLTKKVNKDYFGIFLFDRPVLVVKSPKLVRSILQKDFSSFYDRSIGSPENDPIMSNVMFFSKNPKWKTVRSKFSPVFTSGKLKMMFPLILNESNGMTDYISKFANVPNVESKEICAKYSTNVIAKCAFAVDAQSFKSDDAEFREIGKRLFNFSFSTGLRQLSSWLAPNFVRFFNIRFLDSHSVDRLEVIFTDVLHKRMASSTLKGNDMVDIMLELEKNNKDLVETDLVAQAINFFGAGFETVSATLSFTLYELCINTDIQTKLRNEIFENIKTHNGITYEGTSEMKYLDMCVSETLRKYPVAPFLDRVCNADYKVEGSDLVVEKGLAVYISLFGLHYDPYFFPEPDKYDPERFMDKSQLNNDGLYYIPFGEGPRICIGNRFGLMGVKIGLISILSKYKLERSDKTPIPLKYVSSSVILQSPVGIPLKFVPI